MSTLTQTPGTHAGAPDRPLSHLTFRGVVVSEWIKFRSVRSTVWTIALTLVMMVGLSLLVAFGSTSSGAQTTGVTGSMIVTIGYGFAEITLAVLGVLAITGEYSTGMIRSTLAAVPKRLPALWAKVLVLTVATAITSAVGVGISYLVTSPILSSHELTVDLGDPTTRRVLLGAVLFLVGIALLAFALGALVRHSAAGIAAALGVILLLPILVGIIGNWVGWVADIQPYLPTSAGERIMSTSSDATSASGDVTQLSPWQGLGLMYGYVVVVGAAAAVLLRRRDA